ncbi:MAG TPA: trigger factor [Bacteroidota bacterium]|nr:trigger factor [Bacteroidota bacterium]
MDVAIKDLSEIEKEITIQTSAVELTPHFTRAYEKYRSKLELKGFRKGKAPLAMVIKLHGEAIEYESLNDIATDYYRQAITERDIHPVGEPVLVDMDYKRGEALSFRIKYEIRPTIQLGQYKGIPVERVVHIVTDKEIDDELQRIRRSNSTLTEAESVQGEEFIVTVDVQETDEAGTPILGRKTAGMRVYLADPSVYAEIREALKSVTTGASVRTSFDRETDGGKTKTYLTLTAVKIERVELPEVTDEFVKKITKDKVTSVAEFMRGLRTDIDRYWRDKTERNLTDALIAQIVSRHDIPVPGALVKGILDSMVHDLEQRYPNKKLPPDFKEEEFREENKDTAAFQARWFLLREEILRAEKLEVTDDDVAARAAEDAPRVGMDKERLLGFYKTSDSVRDRILADKLTSFLVQNAAVTERSTEEFFA